jgi:hypothetical protein
MAKRAPKAQDFYGGPGEPFKIKNFKIWVSEMAFPEFSENILENFLILKTFQNSEYLIMAIPLLSTSSNSLT